MSFDAAERSYALYILRFIICMFMCKGLWLVRTVIGSFKSRRELKKLLNKLTKRRIKSKKLRAKLTQSISGVQCNPTDGYCVICSSNNLEIILLPCGHVCLCSDCSSRVECACPICRSRIERKHRAYVC